EGQTLNMPGGIIGDNSEQLFAADQIRQECVADNEREGEKDSMFGDLLAQLGGRPRRLGQCALGKRVALNKVLQLSKYHLHQDGLGTSPAAPQPAERSRKHNDSSEENQHRDRRDNHILRPKNSTEDNEFA